MVESQNVTKKSSRSKSFHFRYLELCRSKNYAALPDVKAKNNNTGSLDFYGDKFKIDDWLLIIESLFHDQTLQSVALRLRRNFHIVLDQIDNEKKARLFRNRPVVFTKFVFSNLVDAVSNCVAQNKNITSLTLEGFPLLEKYALSLAKALSKNNTIKNLSFFRSSIGDKGCEIICSTIKHLPNIESLNIRNCNLTTQGAESLSNLIKFQKICRYSEGWRNSLRYRDVDPDSIPGLRELHIGQNPDIKDAGLKLITEILKEDVWIKVIDMEDCGLTDFGATAIIECLDINKTIVMFNIKHNPAISEQLYKSLKTILGNDSDDSNDSPKENSLSKIMEKIKLLEEQYEAETFRRKQMESLNEKLYEKVMAYQKQLQDKQKADIPENCAVIEKSKLDTLMKERDELKLTISTIKISKNLCLARRKRIRKAKSETVGKSKSLQENKISKSEHGISKPDASKQDPKPFIEKNIGDTKKNNASDENGTEAGFGASNFMGIEALQVFMKKKNKGVSKINHENQVTPQNLFMGMK